MPPSGENRSDTRKSWRYGDDTTGGRKQINVFERH